MNTNFLKSKIIFNGDTQKDLARKIGLGNATFSKKINGLASFTQKEIQAIKDLYNLSNDEVMEIFFDSGVLV